MTDHCSYSPIGAGTPNPHSITILAPTPDGTLTPGLPVSPIAAATEPEDFPSYPPTPEALSKRQLNLFKKRRKAALKLAMLMAMELEMNLQSPSTITQAADLDMPDGYRTGDFGRQARKMVKSKDKHGMLSPNTHKIVKPVVVRYYQYKKCYKTARKMAEAKSKSKKGGTRMGV